jgi:hypothetical protein
MSERSEHDQHGALFGAPRRTAHWRHVSRRRVTRLHDSMVRQ